MAKYILLYNGPATDPADMTEEARNEVMNKWGAWMAEVGEAMVDVGAPMAGGVAVVDDGSTGTATALSGYTIIEAVDVASARQLVEGHPFLGDSDGKFSVEVHELLPVPM